MTRPLFALVLLALTSLASAAPVVNVLEGKVVGVTDGDTIKVLEPARSKDSSPTEHKIRLAGIDAPEKDQPFGQPCQAELVQRRDGQGRTRSNGRSRTATVA